MRKPTHFDALRVIHHLWVENKINIYEVTNILSSVYKLNLTSLTNGGLTAESEDKKAKYKLQ